MITFCSANIRPAWRLLALVGVLASVALFVPLLAIIIILAVLILEGAILGLRLLLTHTSPSHPHAQTEVAPPWFSIHLACCNEPPELVISSVEALLAQDWPIERREVIVVDNNTPDRKVWQPLAEYCRKHSVSFLHFDRLAGAKAGALNEALAVADRRATHVVTIDADYLTDPHYLADCAEELRWGSDHLQYPQAYRCVEGVSEGVARELAIYFRDYAGVASHRLSVLPTGTLSVISMAALRHAGGWSACTVTEDAELGTRLARLGYTGRFVDRVMGRGLLPLSLRSLEEQRQRWIHGNLSALARFLRSPRPANAISGWTTVSVIVQLFAWARWSFVPVVMLLSSLLVTVVSHAMAEPQHAHYRLAQLAAFCLLFQTGIGLFPILREGAAANACWRVRRDAVMASAALQPASVFATMTALCRLPLTFKRTMKQPDNHYSSDRTLVVWVLALLGLMVFGGAILHADILLFTTGAVLMLPLSGALYTRSSLANYARRFADERHEEANAG
ncbi:glycosyltransferase family 2 protein [Notoacmeibacter sp. MSK16QG-6]|uniref:glycosyltransferase family 2 protein n=1 Tax=Notoacmeibacter sp. MSK16QG-6 TaxID=2957982 RepID=UPI00209E88E3|nr:glycosyltransferase family 2 protein [Notoacmeibacter sp. MSK16QG-6]MCP1200862.1 glycosyltransferase [Notoacmeibacter sp. MSK16QG-6]